MAKILEFKEIDNLFLKYKEASAKTNTEKYIEKLKSDIVTSLWNNQGKRIIKKSLFKNFKIW